MMVCTRSKDEIRRWLAAALAEQLEIPLGGVDARASFRRLGLDSIGAGALASRLSAWLGQPVPLTLLWDHPSVAALSEHLSGQSQRQRERELADARAGARSRWSSTNAGGTSAAGPIAVVGMACRFPGGAETPAAFWGLLRGGIDALADIPRERFDVDALHHPDPAAPGRIGMRQAGLLRDVAGFDARFFGISPREAMQADPQQRLMLELSWEALEDAGVPPLSLSGSPTGVFFGAIWSDFALLMARAGLGSIEQTSVTGAHHSVIANRVSYALGLEGPSMAIDTACSASLVAVHLACESLLRGECELALCGGVNLILAPDSLVQMTKFGAMSPDARCRAFDANGDGYARAEGAGVVALKPLAQALADGNPIHCVILGSAVNNDGRSNGLTAPSPRAQRAVLAAACARAGVDPRSIDYVEAHGTGTRLGDPIEAGALGAVYGQDRPPGRPLRVGSVKTNIGHTEAAAGIAGLIKAALSLRHREIPPSLHLRTPNPDIDFEKLGIEVQTRLSGWPAGDGPPRAGVSAFGFGGTNAHVVLEAWHVDVGAFAQDEALPTAAAAAAAAAAATAARRPPVFCFSGHGAQWIGMGRDLLAASPVARAALTAIDREIQAQAGWSLLRELMAPAGASRLHEADVLQPATFAVQVALAALWRDWGVTPGAVVGHSGGELAAAHVAGALALEDAVRAVCLRGRLVRRLSGLGGILVVERPRDALADVLQAEPGLVVAACNSPTSTVLSGDVAALERVAAAQRAAGVRCGLSSVDFAAHSPVVEPLLDELREGLADLAPLPPEIPMISTVTGRPVEGSELGADYWAANLRQPVELAAAVDLLARRGEEVFVEIAPHPVLSGALERCLEHAGRAGVVVASTRRDAPELPTLLESARTLWNAGVALRLDRLPGAGGGAAARDGDSLWILPVSGHTPEALRARVAALRAHLEAHPDLDLDDVCYTAACGRSHLDHRVAAVASTRAGLLERLAAAEQSGAGARPAPDHPPRVALVFPGQGGAWPGMGRELLEREPAFRSALRACDEAIARHAGWSVLAAVREGALPEGRADRDQPLLFALQVALARLWASLGVRPAAVIGHSMGEVAAAHLAGALSLDEAARLICRRSERIRTLTGKGTMAVVEASAGELERLLARWGTRVSCAARNGPRSFVLAGDADVIAAVIAEREAEGAFARPAGFDHISHCAAAEPLSGPLARDLEGLAPRRGEVPIYSTVHGRVTDGADMDAGYWIRQILQPVLFHDQALALLRDGIDVLLEVSPHPVLVHACEQTAAEAGAPAIILDTLRRGEGQRYLYETLARLHQAGVEVRWPATLPRGGRIVPLPPYPFQRQRLWPDALDRAAAAGHDAAPAVALPAEAEPAPELRSIEEALRSSPGAPPAALVEAYLRHQAGALLRLLPDAIPPGLSLKRLGLDSLMAMRLNNRVRAALGVDAPAVLYLEERSLASLAAALCERSSTSTPARTQDAAALVAQMEEGSL